MKILFDFLPIALFFAMFKFSENHQEWAMSAANGLFGNLVSGGVVGPKEAPVLLATFVVIVATILQVVWLKINKKKVDVMLWVSLGSVIVLGGATIYFHSDVFIKWKPTILYWLMAIGLVFSQLVLHKNPIALMLGKELNLPARVWRNVGVSWVIFLVTMGALNLWVAFNFEFGTWVNFKLFGGMGLMLLFALLQGVYISQHLDAEKAP